MLLQKLLVGLSIGVVTAAPLIDNTGIETLGASNGPNGPFVKAHAGTIDKREETKRLTDAGLLSSSSSAHDQPVDAVAPYKEANTVVNGMNHEIPVSEHVSSSGQRVEPEVTLPSTNNEPPAEYPTTKGNSDHGLSAPVAEQPEEHDTCDAEEPEEEVHKKTKHSKKPKHKKPKQAEDPRPPDFLENLDERRWGPIWKRDDLEYNETDESESLSDVQTEADKGENIPGTSLLQVKHYDGQGIGKNETVPSTVGMTNAPATSIVGKTKKMHKCPKKKHKSTDSPKSQNSGITESGNEFDQGRLETHHAPEGLIEEGLEQQKNEIPEAFGSDEKEREEEEEEVDKDVPQAWLIPPPSPRHARSIKRALHSRMTIGYGPFGYGSSSVAAWDHQGHDIDNIAGAPKLAKIEPIPTGKAEGA